MRGRELVDNLAAALAIVPTRTAALGRAAIAATALSASASRKQTDRIPPNRSSDRPLVLVIAEFLSSARSRMTVHRSIQTHDPVPAGMRTQAKRGAPVWMIVPTCSPRSAAVSRPGTSPLTSCTRSI